jgi:hypothetical protein
LEWLFPERIDRRHKELRSNRAENSGEWFLVSPEFIDWVDEKDCNMLYCPGIRTSTAVLYILMQIAGAGKSMIRLLCLLKSLTRSSMAIDYLTTEAAQLFVSYIYFDYKAPQNSDANMVMSSLLKQLLGYPSIQVPASLETIYEAHVKRATRPELQQLEETFRSTVQQLPAFYIVFDAFDECTKDQQPAIRDIILRLSKLPNIKIMVTSRPHSNFLENFELDKVRVFEIKADEGDVRKYLSKELENGKLSEGIKKRILDSLSSKVDGTYLHFYINADFAQVSIGSVPIAARPP